MKNLPELILNIDVNLYTIPNEGNLVAEYKPLKNIQLESGDIVDFNTENIVNTNKFDLSYPVDIEVQSSYDGSVNLILNDDKNPPLLINSRFSVEENSTYIIPDHAGSQNTNLYSETTLDLDTRLYKTITKLPILEYLGLDYNGKMKVGTYNFYFKYADVDDNETDFICESSLVVCHIGNINDPYSIRMGMMNEDSKKSIRFKISNIDIQYDLVKVYYTRTTSDNSGQPITTAHYIDNKYVINGDSLDILISGFENHYDISIDEINPIYELADAVKTQAQCQNRLFFGNIYKPKIEYKELLDLSLRIIPSIENDYNIGNIDYNYIDRTGKNLWEYYNTKNIYNYLGYWPEEYYRFGIVYILKDFTLSPVFNIRGLDLSLNEETKLFHIRDNNNKRIYVNYDSEGYIIDKINEFENSKGVVKLDKKQVIQNSGVYPLGIKFNFIDQLYEEGDDLNGHEIGDVKYSLIDELKKYTKGFFFVRQKRIPTILAQGCTIGKTKDAYGNIPVLSLGDDIEGVVEGFLNNNGENIEKDSNPFLVKRWKWRYAYKYTDESLTNFIDKEIDADPNEVKPGKILDAYNKTLYEDGAHVRHRNRTDMNVGDPIYGYWDYLGDDDDAIQKLKDQLGDTFRLLGQSTLSVNRNNYEIKGAIVPEAELREPLFNQIFTSSKFKITKSSSQSTLKIVQSNDSNKHYYLVQDKLNSDNSIKSVIVTMVNDNLQLTTDGTNLFSARAGEAEEAWKVVDVKYDWNTVSSSEENEINLNLTTNTDYVRGSFGTYIGLGDSSFKGGEIINIRPEDYDDSYNYKLSAFKNRFSSYESYFAISDRIDFNTIIDNSVKCYRGDCFVGNFTHRMQRNFIDPDLPTNDKIIDPYTWYKGFVVRKEVKTSDTEINTILTNFKRNNKGKFLDPSDSKYASAGQIVSAITGLDTWTTSGANNINRSDVNAVKLGHWFTFKVMSNINVSMRDINLMNPSEQSTFGNPRGFFPLNKMSTSGTAKLPDSNIINAANNVTLSHKYNFIIPDVPYIKNKFSNRIQYSDISINDAFRNGYRVFRGGNYKDIPKTYGSLVSLNELFGNLIAVMENGVLLIPVNERVVSGEGDGGQVFINTLNILPENPKVLSSNYGSIWKDSIFVTINNIYGVDTISKKIWKTDGHSFEVISDLKVQKFLNDFINLSETDKENTFGIKNVKTHYNALKGDLMFTFYNNSNVWNLCYNEKLNKFITFYSWIPSFSENINNIFISFDLNNTKINIEEYNKSKDLENYPDYVPNYVIEYFWKHGQAGNYNLEEPIKPTKWYGNQEKFEFEFIVKEIPISQKIFDNLKIISNKSKPEEFEFEVVGEGYDWYNWKDEIIQLNDLTLTTITDSFGEVELLETTLESRYKKYLLSRPQIKKLPFIKRVKYTSDPNKSYKWEYNTTDVWLIEDTQLSEYRIHTNQLGNDIKSVGRVKGNMQYLEDFWNIEIRPINFKYAYLVEDKEDENGYKLNFTKLNQSKIRDKYLKIKVRYSGENLTIIQAIKTLFTISYA